jgi:hypothetical protein
MRELLFLVADLWMVAVGFVFGWRLVRKHRNYLLGIEWMIIATSGTNFLLWALITPDDESSPLYSLAFFLDAFSRSVGFTLILVVGLMQVTHRYRPSKAVDAGLFALATVVGIWLYAFHKPPEDEGVSEGIALLYVNANVLTTAFLIYFSIRLWRIGAQRLALVAGAATAAAFAIAQLYDFVIDHQDKAQEEWFYVAALTTWGFQLFVYFRAYEALDDHQRAAGRTEPSTSRERVLVDAG